MTSFRASILALSLSAIGGATPAGAAAPPLFRWDGSPPSHYGSAVDGAGDVNGDGREDVVIGAPDASIFAPHVEVRSGADGTLLWELYDTSSGEPGGVNSMTRLGIAVAGVGDLDGDGIPDVIAGAHADSRDQYRSGSVRAYSGHDGALIWEVFGEGVYDEFGYRVESAGDVNLDGVDDVIASGLTPLSLRRTVRVLSGVDGAVLHRIVEPGWPDGDGQYSSFGSAVRGVGDLNSDGHPDFAIGAMQDDRNGQDSGSVTIYSGRGGHAIYSVHGDRAGDLLGISLDLVGDLNGDGRPEFIAGATGVTGPDGVEDPGMARVYDGRSGAILHTVYGDGRDRFLGIDVAGVGDMDRDGFPDFAAGTWGYPSTVSDDRTDYVELRSGRNGDLLGRVGSTLFHDGFGFAIAGAGDVNGDGFADLIVGAFQSPQGETVAGRVEVFAGRSQFGIRAEVRLPAVSGGAATVALTGARPNSTLLVFAGRNLGSTPLAGCPPRRALSIRNPIPYSTVVADAAGAAVVTIGFDPARTDSTILLQAVERESCRVSTLAIYVRP